MQSTYYVLPFSSWLGVYSTTTSAQNPYFASPPFSFSGGFPYYFEDTSAVYQYFPTRVPSSSYILSATEKVRMLELAVVIGIAAMGLGLLVSIAYCLYNIHRARTAMTRGAMQEHLDDSDSLFELGSNEDSADEDSALVEESSGNGDDEEESTYIAVSE